METINKALKNMCPMLKITEERFNELSDACAEALDKKDEAGETVTSASIIECYTAGCKTKEEECLMMYGAGAATAIALGGSIGTWQRSKN